MRIKNYATALERTPRYMRESMARRLSRSAPYRSRRTLPPPPVPRARAWLAVTESLLGLVTLGVVAGDSLVYVTCVGAPRAAGGGGSRPVPRGLSCAARHSSRL